MSRPLAMRSLLLLFVCLIAGGCIGEEVPVAPYDRGGVERATVGMESDYRYQIYFDLESGMVVGQNRFTDWDLGFESASDGRHLVLNTSKAMAISDAGPVEFASVTSRADAIWRYDTPDGNLDSTAIGEWGDPQGDSIISRHHVYIINRGYDEKGKQQGYRKMMIESSSDSIFRVRTAMLNGSDDRVIEVPKDPQRNFVALSLSDGTVVGIEPPRTTWDLVFTRYTHIFYEPLLTPYSVTGTLLNMYETTVAVDTTKSFADITSADISGYTFSTGRDGIGYAWKIYDLNKGTYTVDPGINYIIKTASGFVYKLHFTDFYNAVGEKGFPTMEYQKL